MKRTILWLMLLGMIVVPAVVSTAAPKTHSNIGEFTYIQKAGTQVD
jgi:hypothetical protein